TRLHKLSASIEEITDLPHAVETQGNAQSSLIRLSPLLDFNDTRETIPTSGVIQEWYDQYDVPRTTFATSEYRRRALSHLFHQFAESPQAALYLARLQAENSQKSQKEVELPDYRIYSILAYIENGLHAYLHDEDEEAQAMGTYAYYNLLASTVPMVTGLAKSKSWIHTEELIQEGMACVTEAIMDFSGSEDLVSVAEDFYPMCLSRLSFKFSNFITAEVAAKRAMSTKALRLELLIREVEKSFAQEHGRVPTEAEIYAELDDPTISPKRISNALYRMQFGLTGMSYYNRLENVDRSALLMAAIDDQIEQIYREDIAAKVFASRWITDKEKVTLSLYYGIFVENLRGMEVRKTKAGPVFTYPYDAASFDLLAQQTVGNQRGLGAILDYTHRGVGKILEAAREKAHAELEEIVGDDPAF
ncbi:MAG TPA: hypothetical protein VFT59_03445, partial [Candidatus Saccharimonadales bacterium]|nr:hypothetical protein [Candidatus Saccharimonadales bacterium]